MKDHHLELEAKVTECLGHRYRCLTDSGLEVLAHLGGRLIKNRIRVTQGDSIVVSVSLYDTTRGIITKRH
jgi:translation initiation factor IF-1